MTTYEHIIAKREKIKANFALKNISNQQVICIYYIDYLIKIQLAQVNIPKRPKVIVQLDNNNIQKFERNSENKEFGYFFFWKSNKNSISFLELNKSNFLPGFVHNNNQVIYLLFQILGTLTAKQLTEDDTRLMENINSLRNLKNVNSLFQ